MSNNTETQVATSVDDLNSFQRDCIREISQNGPCNGLAVCSFLQKYYSSEVHHSRFYQNIERLIEMGLVEKGQVNRRSNSYELTSEGEQLASELASRWKNV